MGRIHLLVLLVLAGCRQPGLQDTSRGIRLTAVTDFGLAWPGQTVTRRLELHNDGPAALIRWTAPGAPFGLSEDLPTAAPSGKVELTVRFAPTEVGSFEGKLEVEAEGLGAASATLLGRALSIPDCPPPSVCHQVAFEPELGRCVERAVSDGLSCAGANACLLEPSCLAGRCVGVPKSCDDANACTTDTCHPVGGCEHLPAPPCPGDGKCQVGVCHPATGCGLTRAEDGTACGPLQTCAAAEVCISGGCVVRDPPDGHLCAEASPCQGEGRCVGLVCQRPAPVPLVPTWSYDALTADAGAGIKPPLVHDLLLEPDGAVTLTGAFFSTPQLRRNTPAAREPAMGLASRCLLWNGRLICSKPNDAVNAIDLGTGANLWSFNLRTARPGLTVSSLFLARMAVQSSDRLATLWEAYPDPYNCRVYYLAILDAAGGLVSAQQLSDPLFSVCNHPHAYGFGADAAGHVFIAFAPTVKNPPLVSGSPTTVMSYTRDGVFRWKFTDVALKGGELALARGLLYSEHSTAAVLTSTGQPAFLLAEKFGRAVVTSDRLIPAPQLGANRLAGYEAGTNAVRWLHLLAVGQSFGSDQVRLATWSTRQGPQTVALTFTQSGGKNQLHGILARDGREAFSCEVAGSGRTGAQLFEVADGSLAVMDGAAGCGTCEPSHADKSAAFHTLAVPGLKVCSGQPWIGTWGGAGHQHREQP